MASPDPEVYTVGTNRSENANLREDLNSLVEDLNASQLVSAAELELTYIRQDGTTPLTAPWDAGPYQIRALQFYADGAADAGGVHFGDSTQIWQSAADVLYSPDTWLLAAGKSYFVGGDTDVAGTDGVRLHYSSTDDHAVIDVHTAAASKYLSIRTGYGGGETGFARSPVKIRTDTGQVEFPITGLVAGILIGGDFQICRSAADVGYTPDGFRVMGTLGVGTASPTGKLHSYTGSSGQGTPNIYGDELILEGSGHAGLSILTPSTVYASIFFGDEGSATVGRIRYDHTTNTLSHWTADAQRTALSASGLSLGANKLLFGTFGSETVNLYSDTANELKTDDNMHIVGALELTGDLNHDGAAFGALGKAPQAQQAFIADAVDAATTMALVNALKNNIAIGFGFMAAA